MAGLGDMIQYNCAAALTVSGNANNMFNPSEMVIVTNEPIGVVSILIPWNFPVMLLGQKLSPALAAGCTVVVKPSEFAAATVTEILKLFIEAGVPKGVINVVYGPGSEVGAELAENELVDKVSFTGSTATAKNVMKGASNNLKKISLEAGGKSASIILEDADLEAVFQNPGFLFSCFFHSGQVCALGSRVLVHESMKEKFLEKFLAATKNVKVGKPNDPTTLSGMPFCYGAVTAAFQAKKIEDYIKIGQEEGAKLLCGGSRLGGDLSEGLFFPPTIFADVKSEMKIAQEEIFGPVICVLTYKNYDEAISISNSVSHGLAAFIWGSNMNGILKLQRGLKAGMVYVNHFAPPSVVQPFGGYKQSGIGKENGMEGFKAFLESKTTVIKF
eukprot:TRINITY_DN964_c0_g1_i2.p1 TRINITY_DN964_c0_g1~~TRINITY_DN964_c0_g1_i2.p1  ORF type:complete len:386 (-),score=62.42 TRINITY_DN964_c0_g1_i2:61-1218(-)